MYQGGINILEHWLAWPSPILNMKILRTGSVTILLSSFDVPPAKASKCSWHDGPNVAARAKDSVNLFTLAAPIRGWFAVKGQMVNGKTGQTVFIQNIYFRLDAIIGEIR